MASPLGDAIAYWTVTVQRHEAEVAAGLLRADAPCLTYARERLRDLMDIDGTGTPGDEPYPKVNSALAEAPSTKASVSYPKATATGGDQ